MGNKNPERKRVSMGASVNEEKDVTSLKSWMEATCFGCPLRKSCSPIYDVVGRGVYVEGYETQNPDCPIATRLPHWRI